MSAIAVERLPVMDLAAMIRAVEHAMRDGTWKRSPIGAEVAAYLRALQWASHPDTTLDAYTHVLGLLALRHADWPDGLAGFCTPAGPEYLRAACPRRRLGQGVKACVSGGVATGIAGSNAR